MSNRQLIKIFIALQELQWLQNRYNAFEFSVNSVMGIAWFIRSRDALHTEFFSSKNFFGFFYRSALVPLSLTKLKMANQAGLFSIFWIASAKSGHSKILLASHDSSRFHFCRTYEIRSNDVSWELIVRYWIIPWLNYFECQFSGWHVKSSFSCNCWWELLMWNNLPMYIDLS